MGCNRRLGILWNHTCKKKIIINININKMTKLFKFAKHVLTETSVIFSYLMYKAFEVEFIIRRQKY